MIVARRRRGLRAALDERAPRIGIVGIGHELAMLRLARPRPRHGSSTAAAPPRRGACAHDRERRADGLEVEVADRVAQPADPRGQSSRMMRSPVTVAFQVLNQTSCGRPSE